MATFALYNYEFELSLPMYDEKDIFDGKRPSEIAKESFAKKQDVFGKLLQDDYQDNSTLKYKSKKGKDYKHKWLAQPADGIYIFRLLSDHKRKVHDEDLKASSVDDYSGCRVIFDNREGIQRLAIEMNTKAFRNLSQSEDILARGINNYLEKEFFIKIRLEHLLTAAKFWEIVHDKLSYPKGFKELSLYLPPVNLERLSKHLDKILSEARQHLGSDSKLVYKAPPGTVLNLDDKDEWTHQMVEDMSEVGGDATMTLNPFGGKKIVVNKNNYRTFNISDNSLDGIENGTPNLFGSGMDEVKAKLKAGI